jgi:hypothetical protein
VSLIPFVFFVCVRFSVRAWQGGKGNGALLAIRCPGQVAVATQAGTPVGFGVWCLVGLRLRYRLRRELSSSGFICTAFQTAQHDSTSISYTDSRSRGSQPSPQPVL